jgi:hypothetical protein
MATPSFFDTTGKTLLFSLNKIISVKKSVLGIQKKKVAVFPRCFILCKGTLGGIKNEKD